MQKKPLSLTFYQRLMWLSLHSNHSAKFACFFPCSRVAFESQGNTSLWLGSLLRLTLCTSLTLGGSETVITRPNKLHPGVSAALLTSRGMIPPRAPLCLSMQCESAPLIYTPTTHTHARTHAQRAAQTPLLFLFHPLIQCHHCKKSAYIFASHCFSPLGWNHLLCLQPQFFFVLIPAQAQ